MAIPAYLWLKDDGGADIKGSVDVNGREGSIEFKVSGTLCIFQLTGLQARSPAHVYMRH